MRIYAHGRYAVESPSHRSSFEGGQGIQRLYAKRGCGPLGLAQSTLSRFERGKASPSTAQLRHLADLYRVSVEDLYGITTFADGDGTLRVWPHEELKGKVEQAKALYKKAECDVEDSARRIELEVRTAYSNFIEAKEVLESQKKVVEQAEEALRLANARADAGTGTQLDVLSAQTALTEARSTQVQALRDYAVARARLERAIGNSAPRLDGEK